MMAQTQSGERLAWKYAFGTFAAGVAAGFVVSAWLGMGAGVAAVLGGATAGPLMYGLWQVPLMTALVAAAIVVLERINASVGASGVQRATTAGAMAGMYWIFLIYSWWAAT